MLASQALAEPAPGIGGGIPGPEAGALAYWFDIAPEVRLDWLDWYQHDHMPSRVGTAFTMGRCYEAIGSHRSHMVLFGTRTVAGLLEPSYLDLLKVVTPEDRARRRWYTNTIRVTCRVRSQVGRGVGGVLGVVRIAGAALASAEIARCLVDEVVPRLEREPRLGAMSLLEHDPAIRARMDQVRLTGHQDASADWALLIEAGHDADLVASIGSLQALPAWRSLRLGEAVSYERYRLLHSMTQ